MNKSPKRNWASAPADRWLPVAFLLTQVGAHAASKFAERLEPLKLAPRHAGVLSILGSTPALTQQSLADMLRMLPSGLVGLIDELESRGLIERREKPHDRRSYALHLTDKGRSTLESIRRISREHQKALLGTLSEDEQQELGRLLQRVADEQGLTPGVHPSYTRLRGPAKRRMS
jgi:DNA-binding MarR family transcriptional regulator